MGHSPPGAVCFSAGLPQVHKSCLKTCSSIHGATGPARALLHGLLWACPLALALAWGPHGLQGVSGLQRNVLPHHGLPHRLQGNLLSCACNNLSSSVFTDLGVCRGLFFSHIFSLLSFTCCCAAVYFPLPKDVTPEVLLLGLALAGASWILLALALSNTGEASGIFSQKTPLCPHQHQSVAMQTQHNPLNM